jgi:protease-4
MSQPELPNDLSPTLQPIPPSVGPGTPRGPGGGEPPGRSAPPPAARPRKSVSAVKVVLLILGGLALLGSVALNAVLLADIGAGFEHRISMQTSVLKAGRTSETVALYGVEGIIDSRAAAQFEQFYKAVADDGNVKAVVLRVNSPGGGVTASDRICEMVKALRTKGKKVVVSMGSLAASGAYYISAPADEIYAEATTITGSIGVVAWWVVLKGTLDKIGAEPVIIKSSHSTGWKDEMSSFSRPHEYQRRHIRDVLDKLQGRFEENVLAGRGKRLKTRSRTYTIPASEDGGEPVEHTETEPLNGKIYLAESAKQFGLIDGIGFQDAAIRRAARLAGLGRERVVHYARRRSMMERLMEGKSAGSMKLGLDLLDKLQTPRFMMIWKAD